MMAGSVRAELIEAPRLELRPLSPAHVAEMTNVLADPDLYTFTGGEPPGHSELRARYERWSKGSPDPAVSWLNWVIWLRADGCLAGTVQATITWDGDRGVAEVAWVVGRPWQGRDIATEAAHALVSWLRTKPVGLVLAHIHPDHRASAAVAAAAGLTPANQWQDGERRWQLVL